MRVSINNSLSTSSLPMARTAHRRVEPDERRDRRRRQRRHNRGGGRRSTDVPETRSDADASARQEPSLHPLSREEILAAQLIHLRRAGR